MCIYGLFGLFNDVAPSPTNMAYLQGKVVDTYMHFDLSVRRTPCVASPYIPQTWMDMAKQC